LFDVEKNIRVASWEAVGVDKAFSLVKATA
jgi:hypothetical protein